MRMKFSSQTVPSSPILNSYFPMNISLMFQNEFPSIRNSIIWKKKVKYNNSHQNSKTDLAEFQKKEKSLFE